MVSAQGMGAISERDARPGAAPLPLPAALSFHAHAKLGNRRIVHVRGWSPATEDRAQVRRGLSCLRPVSIRRIIPGFLKSLFRALFQPRKQSSSGSPIVLLHASAPSHGVNHKCGSFGNAGNRIGTIRNVK